MHLEDRSQFLCVNGAGTHGSAQVTRPPGHLRIVRGSVRSLSSLWLQQQTATFIRRVATDKTVSSTSLHFSESQTLGFSFPGAQTLLRTQCAVVGTIRPANNRRRQQVAPLETKRRFSPFELTTPGFVERGTHSAIDFMLV